MARGGYRPGAGRPKGSKGKTAPSMPVECMPVGVAGSEAVAVPVANGTTPLAFMLAMMNDPNADPVIRARMAIAAAPFMHTRIAEGGKKEEKAKAAKDASKGKFAPAAPPKLVVNNR